MVRLLVLCLVAGCTTLEGFEPSLGSHMFLLLHDARDKLPGGLVRFDPDKRQILFTTEMAARCHAPCPNDADQDALDDDWEAVALESLRPALALREDEPSFLGGDGGLTSIGRISPANNGGIVAFYLFLWDDDTGRCSMGRHHGDVERIVISLTEVSPKVWRIAGLFTSAHETTATDRSEIVRDEELAELFWMRRFDGDDDHVVVQVAAGKHAFYPFNTAACPTDGSACLRDMCSGLPHPRPVLLLTHDVGEPLAPKWPPVPIDPWSSEPYCGIPSRELLMPCSSATFEKLMADPLVAIPSR